MWWQLNYWFHTPNVGKKPRKKHPWSLLKNNYKGSFAVFTDQSPQFVISLPVFTLEVFNDDSLRKFSIRRFEKDFEGFAVEQQMVGTSEIVNLGLVLESSDRGKYKQTC